MSLSLFVDLIYQHQWQLLRSRIARFTKSIMTKCHVQGDLPKNHWKPGHSKIRHIETSLYIKKILKKIVWKVQACFKETNAQIFISTIQKLHCFELRLFTTRLAIYENVFFATKFLKFWSIFAYIFLIFIILEDPPYYCNYAGPWIMQLIYISQQS